MAQSTPQWETVPQRDYSRMTEQEALEILRREYPEHTASGEDLVAHHLSVVEFLSVLDSFA